MLHVLPVILVQGNADAGAGVQLQAVDVIGLTQRVNEMACRLPGVADFMAMGIVDRLEAVHVDEQHAHPFAAAARAGEQPLREFQGELAVRQAGQGIVLRLLHCMPTQMGNVEMGVDSRQQLTSAKGLDQIIVSPGLQPLDPRFFARPGG